MVNAYALYKRIQDENINILKCLFSPYHFDKRGHNKQNENTTTFMNIMSFKNNNLYFRYLRSYIDSGHKKRNIELKKSQILALNYLDKLLDEDSMQFKIKINKGECIFINNNFIAHGRGAFVDHKELSKKRLYLRLWIA